MKIGECIADILKAYEVTHVFKIEAILRITIMELEKRGIKVVMPHSEIAAGYMADGYARISRKPGICFAQSIGSANLAAGIHDAWLGCSPVIAITGKKEISLQYRNAYQESDHIQFFNSLTKFNADIHDPLHLPFFLQRCFKEATSGKPRPVHLDILGYNGRMTENTEILRKPETDLVYAKFPSIRHKASETDIITAVQEIEKSVKPVIVAGRGAIYSDTGASLTKLIEKLTIPIVTTPDGKTIIAENHDLWRGIVGSYGMDCANKTVEEADLVIYIGSQTSDQTTLNWTVPAVGTRIIQIDLDSNELGKNYPNCINLMGDAKEVIDQLLNTSRPRISVDWVRQTKEYLMDTLEEQADLLGNMTNKITPAALVSKINRNLPDNAVLVSDTGYSAILTSTFTRLKNTQSYIRAAGSLGWAFPASLGIKCGVPERPVICFIGDGGFYYHLSEIETAVRCGINTITIINNNRILAQCANDINGIFGSEKGSHHYTFTDVSFTAIAKQMGAVAYCIREESEFDSVFSLALNENKPVVIEVITDSVTTVPSPYKSRK
jgi:acetolactate synthase-1/2/3 large subunit